MKRIIVVASLFFLSACAYMQPHYKPQAYTVSGDNTRELKKYGVGNIDVGPITRTAKFDNSCRYVAGVVEQPDSSGFEGYFRNAFIQELKHADMFDDKSPKVTLTGDIDKLTLLTWRNIYLSSWDLGVHLRSSNGNSEYITLHYDFNAGPDFLPDCQQVADSYMFAVQQTLRKLIEAPEFQSLITP